MSASLRFPKSARLTRASEFLKVKTEGRSFHGRFIVLGALDFSARKLPPNQPSQQKAEAELPQKIEPSSARIGVITSRRVGSAVTRNRVRRRLRELTRVSRPRMRDDLWLVLIARASAAKATFREIEKDWLALAKRAAIFCES